MMRITHYNLTTTTKQGGVETFVWDLAAEQARQGHEVTIIGGAGHVRRVQAGVRVYTVPFIDRSHFAWGPFKRAYALRKLWERLSMVPAALPLLHAAELVHIHKPYDLVLGPWLRWRGVPLIYHGHGEDFFRGDRILMRSAAAVLSCSAYNARTLINHYKRDPVVVYNGVDVQRFVPQQVSTQLKDQLRRGADTLVLLPGRMMPWKGHATVLDALAMVERSVQLVIVGDGEMRSALEQQVVQHNLQERVQFWGTVAHSEMARLLAAADIVVGASYASETFGMVLAEALACERPVLASSWHGYDDVVLDHVCGRRFEAQNSAHLAHVLTEMIDQPAQRAAYARAGRQRVLEQFAWQRIAQRVQDVYNQVVGTAG